MDTQSRHLHKEIDLDRSPHIQYMVNRKIIYIILFTVITFIVLFLSFDENIFAITLLNANLFFFSISILFFHKQLKVKNKYISGKRFKLNLLINSFLFRSIIILAVYIYMYIYSDFDLGAEEYDTLFYNKGALALVNLYKGLRVENNLFLLLIGSSFDDLGYIFILSLKYLISDNLLLIKLFQGFVDSISVILIYKIGSMMFEEGTARMASIIYCVSTPFVIFASIHTKEVYMIFFLLLSIYYTSLIIKKGFNTFNVFIIIVSIIILFSMRYVLGIIVLISILTSLMYSSYHIPISKRVMSISFIITAFIILVYQIGYLPELTEKLLGYLGFDSNLKLGGRTADQYVERGQSFAKYVSAPIMLPLSLITPFPSVVKADVKEYYNFSIQWLFTAGLFIWCYLSYFSFLGLYDSIKYNLKGRLILMIILIGYTLALLASMYITSIRFNLPKMALLTFFIAHGMQIHKSKYNIYLIIYMIVMSFMIVSWNYVKLAGRGLI